MQLLSALWLHGLWIVALAAVAQALWLVRRRRALGGFVAPAMVGAVVRRAGVRWSLAAVRAGLLVLALGLIVAGLARPAWNPTPRPTERSGRDVVFLVDVSRSMLAADIAPNRLERAKLAIRDVLDAARGDRFGVIAFAGTTVVKCPLTTDYGFVRLAVDDLSPDSVARGGTLIGDAIRTALEQLFTGDDTSTDRFRDIILITDGEDQDSSPVDAAAAAGKRGIRIVAIGMGSAEGAGVPVRNGPRVEELTYDGKPVRSRMDPQELSKIAQASSGGVFLNVGTGNIELDRVYRRLSAASARHTIDDASAMRYTEGFQVFLAAALGLLVAEAFVREAGRAA